MMYLLELGEIVSESFTSSESGLTAYISEKLFDTNTINEKLTQFPLEPVTIEFTSELMNQHAKVVLQFTRAFMPEDAIIEITAGMKLLKELH